MLLFRLPRDHSGKFPRAPLTLQADDTWWLRAKPAALCPAGRKLLSFAPRLPTDPTAWIPEAAVIHSSLRSTGFHSSDGGNGQHAEDSGNTMIVGKSLRPHQHQPVFPVSTKCPICVFACRRRRSWQNYRTEALLKLVPQPHPQSCRQYPRNYRVVWRDVTEDSILPCLGPSWEYAVVTVAASPSYTRTDKSPRKSTSLTWDMQSIQYAPTLSSCAVLASIGGSREHLTMATQLRCQYWCTCPWKDEERWMWPMGWQRSDAGGPSMAAVATSWTPKHNKQDL